VATLCSLMTASIHVVIEQTSRWDLRDMAPEMMTPDESGSDDLPPSSIRPGVGYEFAVMMTVIEVLYLLFLPSLPV